MKQRGEQVRPEPDGHPDGRSRLGTGVDSGGRRRYNQAMENIYVLTNPPMRGVGLPLGAYSSLEVAEQAAADFGYDCRIQRVVLDAAADYDACETIFPASVS